MMAAPFDFTKEQFADLRGDLKINASLHKYSWFRTGGPAALLFRPEDVADLIAFVAALPKDVPLICLGVGSNVLIRDGGLDAAVVHLGKAFSSVKVCGDTLCVGGGSLDFAVADVARDHSVAGLEFLRGIPGMIGGAVKMNAGAYGREIADILIDADVLSRDGQVRTYTTAELDFSYRKSSLPEDAIVLSAHMRGRLGNKDCITSEIERIVAAREDSQPLRTRTGGSTFKNPVSDERKAWQLIDEAGCRGLRRGAAIVSEKHCNFLINEGGATAGDIEGLGEEVRARVLEKTGVTLEWEIRRLGKAGV